jgi:hypothetical protein
MEEDSPTSYDLLNDMDDSLPGEGEERKENRVEQDELDAQVPRSSLPDEYQDFLSSEHQVDLYGSDADNFDDDLRAGVANVAAGTVLNTAGEALGFEGLNIAPDLFPRPSDTSVAYSQVTTTSRPSPPAGEEESLGRVPQVSAPLATAAAQLSRPGTNEVIRMLLSLDKRIRVLESENLVLKGRAKEAKHLAIQATRVAVSAETNLKTAKTFLKKMIDHVHSEALKAVAQRDLDQAGSLTRDVNALMHWKKTMDERVGSLELDMRSDDGLLMSMIQECKSLAAAGDASK